MLCDLIVCVNTELAVAPGCGLYYTSNQNAKHKGSKSTAAATKGKVRICRRATENNGGLFIRALQYTLHYRNYCICMQHACLCMLHASPH